MWETVFHKHPRVIGRRIADEMLLVPIQGNLADMQSLFALNPVAEYIWELCDGTKTLREIHQNLLDEFEVSSEQAQNDLLEFVQALQQADLIEDAVAGAPLTVDA